MLTTRRNKVSSVKAHEPEQVNVIVRALDILELFEQTSAPLTMMDVTRRTGLHKSTAFRLLTTLVHDGLLQQTASGEYELGGFSARLANVKRQADPLWRAARPIMEDLCARLNESVVLTRRYGDDCIDLDLVSASTPVVQTPAIGRRVPLHAHPGGCAILATATAPDREDYIRRASAGGEAKAQIIDALNSRKETIAEVIRGPDCAAVAVIWLTIAPGRSFEKEAFRSALRQRCETAFAQHQIQTP